MADVTLATMRTQALREADAEGHLDMAITADKDRVTDYVNAGCERLHDILCEVFEDYQITVGAAISIAAGQDFQVMSSYTNLLKVRFVEFWPSGSFSVPPPIDVEPIAMAERNRYTGSRGYFISGTSGGGARIDVRPSADAPGLYRAWYTPTLTALVADGDTFPSVNGWHRWAVLEAAIRLRSDMEKDASRLVQRQADLEKHIRSIASRRISGRPAKVRRVRKTMAEWARDWADPSRWL